MSRRKVAISVHRKSETPGMPDFTTTLTMGTALVFRRLVEVGSAGITTKDFPGWDVRHYLRVMRNKGIGIHDKWETNALGRHKRWWLRNGHSFREVPYPVKKKPARRAGQTSNSSHRNIEKPE